MTRTVDDLSRYGPDGPIAASVSLAEAQAYCRRLARSHYENFTVASWLLPRRLRQHFYNVYAYCRWADDLADETGDPQESLRLLDWWEEQLREMYGGNPQGPVFTALRETTVAFGIPIEPLAQLLDAFRRDQTQTRYASHDDVLQYARDSANPVGRLVLYLGAATGMNWSRFPIPSARDCNWRISAKMWPKIGGAAEFIFPKTPAGGSASAKRCLLAKSSTAPSGTCSKAK